MSFQKAIFISLGVGTTLALAGCGAQDTPQGSGGTAGVVAAGGTPGGAGITGAGGTTMAAAGATGVAGTGTAGTTGAAGATTAGGPGTTCATTNLMGYMNNPAMPISFTTDILPMFGLSCVTSDCHNSNETAPRAGLQLGYKCAYDATAKWKCTFPTAVPSDPTQPAPDGPATVMAVYQSLMAPSTTAQGAMARVKPGDPYNSFLMLKLADQENSRGLSCMNQDASHETNPGPCGVNMPQGADPWCDGDTRSKFDAIGQWIANGAPMN
jgi:hypothetical protein